MMIKYTKDILVFKTSRKVNLYSQEEKNQIEEISKKVENERLIDLIYSLSELENDIKWSTQKNIVFEAGLINLCNRNSNLKKNLEERVEKIEKYLKSGINQNTPKTVAANNSNIYKEQKISGTKPVSNTNTVNRASTNNTSNISKTINKKYPNKAEAFWPEIVNDLKQNGKIVLYTNLINTKAVELNDMTIGIEFSKQLTPFGKTILEKQENIKELTTLVSMACGKEMQIKYITPKKKQELTREEDLKNLTNGSDISFNIIE